MFAFFIRLTAFLGAAFILAIGLAVLVNVHPESIGGVVVWLILFALVLLLSYGSYRGMVHGAGLGRYREPGVGAGLLMGAGIESARQRDSDDIGDGFGD